MGSRHESKQGRRATRFVSALIAAVACMAPFAATAAAAGFEIPSFEAQGLRADQSPSEGAGERPDEVINNFKVNLIHGRPPNTPLPAGSIKDVISDLPPGIAGNAADFPKCEQEQLDAIAPTCPIASQVGFAELELRWGSFAAGKQVWTVPIFNMEPPLGVAAQFAFRTTASITHVNFHVRTGSDYGVTAVVSNINETAPVMASDLTIWGVPGDPINDDRRVPSAGGQPGETVTPYPEGPPYKPLLSNPTSCGRPLVSSMAATTWQNPDQAVSATPAVAPAMTGCDKVDFEPEIEATPTTNKGDSPTGLDFHLRIPQNQDSDGTAVAHLRESKVVLPPSLTVNPSSANGLGDCDLSQIGYLGQGGEKQIIRYDKVLTATFTVSYGGASTAPIPGLASASEVAQALETLPGLAGNLSVSGAPGGWIVEFGGALAGEGVAQLTGSTAQNSVQTVDVTGTAGGFNLYFGGQSTGASFKASFGAGEAFFFYNSATREPKPAEPIEGPGIAPGTKFEFVAGAPEGVGLISLPTTEAQTDALIGIGQPFDLSAAALQDALWNIPALEGNVFVSSTGTSGDTRSFRVVFGGDLAGTEPALLTATSGLDGPGAGVVVAQVPASGPGPLTVDTIEAAGTPQFTPNPAACPDAAKIGTVEIKSPAVIDHPLQGFVYLASQNQNPFNSLLAIYITVNDPKSGVAVKLPGLIEADPKTGQLTATVSETPQLPFEDLNLEFFKGNGAPLKTGIACDTAKVTSEMTPWSAPEGATVKADGAPFSIDQNCSASEAAAPNKPSFEAGTADPVAGDYSPFSLRLSRQDGSQQLTGIDTTLPKGLIAKLAGTPYCSDAALASAASKSGKAEQASASCPAASKVGSVTVGAGAGPTPFYAGGGAYLAGPYKGAPLSLAVITPAVAGPFDLGTVVIRNALYVDPETAVVHAVSDPFPTILQGIPLDLRSVVLNLDKSQFTKNPTSCNPLAITGALTALTGQSAAINQRFQVGDCKRLAFKPSLALNLSGPTKRSGYPALRAQLTMPANGANIAAASVALPHSEFLAQEHIRTVCTRVQFNAGAGNGAECPKRSVYGKATATTPLLDQPLSGPVYLRSSSNPLPDLVAALHGQIDISLVGRIDSSKGGIRTTFASVPDAPISKFTLRMQGGKQGLLVNSRNLCKSVNRALAVFDAQNGKSTEVTPELKSKCGRKAKKGKKGAARR